jgi:RHS repeat-associated protein
LTDREGNIVWAADYRVWGEVSLRKTGTDGSARYARRRQAEPPPVLEQPFRFQGQQFDEETGLHYNRYRYYDPGVGRFVSQDPIGLRGGSNLFAYAPNPMGWVDPFGLSRNKQDKCPSCSAADRMNAQVDIKNDTATVNFRERRATSLSQDDIGALKSELKDKGVKNVVVNSGEVVEPTGRMRRILQRKADTGGTWNGLNVWATGNPKNEFVLTGNL